MWKACEWQQLHFAESQQQSQTHCQHSQSSSIEKKLDGTPSVMDWTPQSLDVNIIEALLNLEGEPANVEKRGTFGTSFKKPGELFKKQQKLV